MSRLSNKKISEFIRKFNKAVKNNSYVFLQHKDTINKAIKYLGLSKEKATVIGNVARAQYKIEKGLDKKTVKREKQRKVRDNLLNAGVERSDVKILINNERYLKQLTKSESRKSLNKMIARMVKNKINDTHIFKLNGSFRYQLGDDRINEFEKALFEKIENSNAPHRLLLNFSENLDKAFEIIYGNDDVKGMYPHQHLMGANRVKSAEKMLSILEEFILKD